MRQFLLAAAGLCALPAHADQAEEIARLRQEAAGLRLSLESLESRIRGLEGAAPETRKPAAASLVSVHQAWSEVRPGVSKERVHALLGEPERVLRINGDWVWYYLYPGLGKGSVFFNRADEVTGVQAPRVGF